ncbi:MAG: hypothetical protein U0441_14195 [Polyangiaceae bacterium]
MGSITVDEVKAMLTRAKALLADDDLERSLPLFDAATEAALAFDALTRLSIETEAASAVSSYLFIHRGTDQKAWCLSHEQALRSHLNTTPDAPSLLRERAYSALGELTECSGKLTDSAEWYGRALEELSSRTSGSQGNTLKQCLNYLAHQGALLRIGREEEAISSSERALLLARSLDRDRDKRAFQFGFTLQKATALLLLGRFTESAALLESIETTVPEGGARNEVREYLGYARARRACYWSESGALKERIP